jgi:hypothetical protein
MPNFKTFNLNKSFGKLIKKSFNPLWIIYPQGAGKVIHTPIYGGFNRLKMGNPTLGGGITKECLGEKADSWAENFPNLESLLLIGS